MGVPMDRETSAERGTYLESWKAIAAYLGRDVTTAQRWERSEGLPVHRLVHSKGGSVYAYSNEVDEWRTRRSRVPAVTAPVDIDVTPHRHHVDQLPPDALPAPAERVAVPGTGAPAPTIDEERRPRFRRSLWLGIGAALALVVGGTAAWLYGARAGFSASEGRAAGQSLPPAAYEEYLKGRHLLTENRLQSIQESIQHFQAALKIAPLYAPAYAGLASAHTDLATIGFGVMPPEQALPRALAAAREAVRLDPALAEGYSVLGRALVVQYSWGEAGEAYAKALELNPNDARTHMSVRGVVGVPAPRHRSDRAR